MNKFIKLHSSSEDDNLPPEVSDKINPIIDKMMKKIDPELKMISKIIKKSPISKDIEIEIGDGVSKLSPIQLLKSTNIPNQYNPEDDLVEGIKQILNVSYDNTNFDVLGTTYDKNYTVAVSISKILLTARKRDKDSLVDELEVIIKRLQG